MNYTLIPHMKVQAANIHSCGFMVGGAPLMAASLFAHAIARQLDVPDEGIILIHHDRQELGKWTTKGIYTDPKDKKTYLGLIPQFLPQQRRGAVYIDKTDYSSKNKHALSLQPTVTAHLDISLILALEGVSNTGLLDKLIRDQTRFAGGQIISIGKIAHYGDLWDVTEKMPNGFLVQDRQADLLAHQQATGLNRIEALVDLLAMRADGEAARSWMSAAVLGYALLEAPVKRAGAREGYAHAYAEPLVGLVQYVSKRQFLESWMDGESGEEPLWQRVWHEPDNGSPAYFTLQQNLDDGE